MKKNLAMKNFMQTMENMEKLAYHQWPWEEVVSDIKTTILGLASLINVFKPGIAGDLFNLPNIEDRTDLMYNYDGVDVDDIETYEIYHKAKEAYDFAYQKRYFSEEDDDEERDYFYGKMGIFLEICRALPNYDPEASSTPICRKHTPLNVLYRTLGARIKLHSGEDLDIEGLSVLAGMNPMSVRSSISRDGYKLKPLSLEPLSLEPRENKSLYVLSNEDALNWLSRRRLFIPKRKA